MRNSALNYWFEAAQDALHEVDVFLTPEQLQAVAESLSTSHENYSMSFGYDVISSPQNQEIQALKEAHKNELEESRRRERVFIDYIAEREKVDQARIAVDGSHVFFHR